MAVSKPRPLEQTGPARDSEQKTRRPSLRAALFAFLSILLLLTAALFVSIFRHRGPEAVLYASGNLPPPEAPVYARLRPLKKFAPQWVLRLKDALIGPRRSVGIETTLWKIQHWPPPETFQALGGPALTGEDGLNIWIADAGSLKKFAASLGNEKSNERVGAPRIGTVDGGACAISATRRVILNGATNDVGLSARFFPRLHRTSTDLRLSVCDTALRTNRAGVSATNLAMIQTNLLISARLEIPTNFGALLLWTNAPNSSHAATNAPALLLSLFR